MRPDRTPRAPSALRALGALLLALGLGLAFLAPAEFYVFYLFAEGGSYHYPGFGIGAFMFANIAAQIAAYYILAALLLVLGCGHLYLRRWVRPLIEVLLQVWVVAGLPLILVFVAVLLATRDLAPVAAITFSLLLALCYPLLPWGLRRLYARPGVVLALHSGTEQAAWHERVPASVAALAALYALVIVILHLLLLLNGTVALYGRWINGLPGVILLAAGIVWMEVLLWGTLGRRPWAWPAGWVTMTLGGGSWIASLADLSWRRVLVAFSLPPAEIAMLQDLPLRGTNLADLLLMPLALLLIQIVRARDDSQIDAVQTAAETPTVAMADALY